MKGTNCSIAIGLGSSSDLSAHMRLAVPAEDSCATIGGMVSFRFSTNIFQLHWCMKRRQPPAISSSPSGERGTMLSRELSEAPKYSSKPGPASLIFTKMKPRWLRTCPTLARPLPDAHSCSRLCSSPVFSGTASGAPSVLKVQAWYGQRKNLPVLPQGPFTSRDPLWAQRFISTRTLPSVWRTTISGWPAISLLLQLEQFLTGVQVAVHAVALHQRANRIGVVSVRGHGSRGSLVQMSSTRRVPLAREMQICMTLPCAFSRALSTWSRWSIPPSSTGTAHTPHAPRLQSN